MTGESLLYLFVTLSIFLFPLTFALLFLWVSINWILNLSRCMGVPLSLQQKLIFIFRLISVFCLVLACCVNMFMLYMCCMMCFMRVVFSCYNFRALFFVFYERVVFVLYFRVVWTLSNELVGVLYKLNTCYINWMCVIVLLCCIVLTFYSFSFSFSACLKLFLIYSNFLVFWNNYYQNVGGKIPDLLYLFL